jgi:hypothetical protein
MNVSRGQKDRTGRGSGVASGGCGGGVGALRYRTSSKLRIKVGIASKYVVDQLCMQSSQKVNT